MVLSGTPLIGDGNFVDTKSLITVMKQAGIPSADFYLNGPFVSLGRWFHRSMTMSTKKTMDYAFNSEAHRSSLKVLPLRRELRSGIKRAFKNYPDARYFITSQSIMAE